VKYAVIEGSYQNLLAPTDFEMQSRQSISFVKNICPSAKIKAIHAYDTFVTAGIYTAGSYTLENFDIQEYNEAIKTSSESKIKEFMQDLEIEKGKVVDGKLDVKKVLLKEIKKRHYDLVVVGSRATSGFQALLGSVALYLLKEAPSDVLLYVPVE